MDKIKEENYVKEAFDSLITRGLVKCNMFSPSTVNDKDLDEFENKFSVKLPSLLRTFLKTYCYDFNYIKGHMPEDGLEDYEDGYYVTPIWLDLVSVPKDNPLQNLYDRMEGFREVTTDEELIGLKEEQIAHLLPIGDWYAGAGPLCIDLSLDESKIDINDSSTWNLCWFDHEIFDWEDEEYLDSSGTARGDKCLPDFKTLLDIYFYGKYDSIYEEFQKEDNEDAPDYSTYIDV